MFKKSISALVLMGMFSAAQAAPVIEENFNNVENLAGKGWIMTNASTPVGATGWFQGNDFDAHAGASTAYIAANYANAAPGGTINNWLITPTFSTSNFVTVAFWARAAAADGFSDNLAYGFSNGSGALIDFVMGDIFTVGTDGWNLYTARIESQGYGSTARFGIQYSGAADESNTVGIDTLSVNIPEPASMLILGTGLLGLIASRRRKQQA